MVVTIAVMTIGIVGISAAVSQAHNVAGVTQDQAQLEVAMRQLADYVRDSAATTTGLAYKTCAKVADYSSSNNANYPTTPQGVSSWGVTSVGLSSGSTRNGTTVPPLTNGYCKTVGTCNAANLCDYGVQEITLQVTNGLHTLTRTVWKSSGW